MKKYIEIATMFTSWFALVLQLYLFEGIIANFFSYFTILSNLLVALSLAAITFIPKTKIGKICLLASAKSAIALYITIVGLVYNLILRGIWEPKGWQLVADNLLHVIVPISYLIYWLFFVNKKSLSWKNGITWSYFPLLYFAYSLIRGHFVNWYPYPFLNVSKIGYLQVFINTGAVILVFITIGSAMIAFNKIKEK